MYRNKTWVIAIPYTPNRQSIAFQIANSILKIGESYSHVNVLVFLSLNNGAVSIGKYRQNIIDTISEEFKDDVDYFSFHDSDDFDPKSIENYVIYGIAAMEQRCDVCELRGHYYENGVFKGVFEHSTKYDAWKNHDSNNTPVKYERTPNHLNPTKFQIVKQIGYKDMAHGEDYDYIKRLQESGLITSQFRIPEGCITYTYLKTL